MDILFKSLTAAVATALILVLNKFFGPKIAGAIGGLPIVFAISYIFISLNNPENSKNFLTGGVYGSIAAIFFSFILIWLNSQFPNIVWVNFTLAYIFCFLFSLGLVYITQK